MLTIHRHFINVSLYHLLIPTELRKLKRQIRKTRSFSIQIYVITYKNTYSLEETKTTVGDEVM